ncbi:hypothetical protein NJB1604_38120 [Mycobacterium marinum]|uniref:DUF1490 family protein n=1 Tax=Mycobacterium marinum TaxID=1781 RepID=UPI0021C2708C|nr:DUF1490 family protein [Mycobacterium marinum]GJO50907.1 hypothetical protein NJB1604_38120 [Mycobacterium marinum]
MTLWHGLWTKAVPSVVTGVVGVATYEALAKAPWRSATVTATAWGLRTARTTERRTKQATERVRLAAADVLAEAVERVGAEVAPPPTMDTPPSIVTKANNACH